MGKCKIFVSQDGSGSNGYKVNFESAVGSVKTNDVFLLFSRPIRKGSELECSIGYGLTPEGKLRRVEYNPFCYFQTQISFGLNFLVNAPFALTSTRESLDFANDESVRENKSRLAVLSDLLADSLDYMQSMGERDETMRFLDDEIFDVLPLSDDFLPEQERKKLNFLQNDDNDYFGGFYTKPLAKFKNNPVVPISQSPGFCCGCDFARAASLKKIAQTFSDEDLTLLFTDEGDEKLHWTIREKSGYDKSNDIDSYCDEIGIERIDDRDIINAACGCIIEGRCAAGDWTWLEKFYGWLSERVMQNKDLLRLSREERLFLDQNGEAHAAFYDKRPVLYIPSDDGAASSGEKISFVHQRLHAMVSVRELEHSLGMVELGDTERVDRLFRLTRKGDGSIDDSIVIQLFKLCLDPAISHEIYEKIVAWVRRTPVFLTMDEKEHCSHDMLCVKTPLWDGFEQIGAGWKRWFVDVEYYRKACGDGIERLFREIGIGEVPQVQTIGPLLLKDWNNNWWRRKFVENKDEIRKHASESMRKWLGYLREVNINLSFTSTCLKYRNIACLEWLLSEFVASVDDDVERKVLLSSWIWKIILQMAAKGYLSDGCFRGNTLDSSPMREILGVMGAVSLRETLMKKCIISIL